ncbi:MAG TPA: hypothetical protein ENJ99_00345 [Rhizobiales bacterium]|nr:hypothetical protein [Hyphomicrobiales bacterium]
MSNENEIEHKSPPQKAPPEPAKAPPPPPAPAPAPRRRKGGFFRSLISHLVFAAIAVIGVGTYIHWDMILSKTGSTVCRYEMLGKYAKSPQKNPAAAADRAPDTSGGPAKTSSGPAVPGTASTPPAISAPAETNAPQTGKAAGGKQAPSPQAKADGKKGFEDAWREARKLFWKQDKKATGAYEALAASHPGNAELLGELGNVYYMNNQRDKAAQAYVRAGERFIETGKPARARDLVKVLEQIAPEKAEQLSARLDAAQ